MTALTVPAAPPADVQQTFEQAKAQMQQRAIWLADAHLANDVRNIALFKRMYAEARTAYRDAALAYFGHEVTC